MSKKLHPDQMFQRTHGARAALYVLKSKDHSLSDKTRSPLELFLTSINRNLKSQFWDFFGENLEERDNLS